MPPVRYGTPRLLERDGTAAPARTLQSSGAIPAGKSTGTWRGVGGNSASHRLRLTGVPIAQASDDEEVPLQSRGVRRDRTATQAAERVAKAPPTLSRLRSPAQNRTRGA